MPDALDRELRGLLDLEVETGAVLLARVVTLGSETRLLARELHHVPADAYLRRSSHELLIGSHGYVPALGRAEETGTIAIWMHTHPGNGSSAQASTHDCEVDRQLSELFRLRTGAAYYGALILARDDEQLRFTGFLENDEHQRVAIDRVVSVGPRIRLAWNELSGLDPIPSMFDRNVRAFGGEVQRVLQDLSIAIVGCGGTGSAVAEQLVRLGVRKFTLVDPDHLSESNVTRVYGSTPRDVSNPKVDVVARNLCSIAPTAEVTKLQSMVTQENTARALSCVDVIFGCTDDNAGRLVLARLSTYLLIPVFDCGVLVSSDPSGRLDGIFGRVTVMHPGAACLVCRDRIDLSRARSELMTPDERLRRADEGYAPALANVEPAVVAFTTSVAAAVVCELLERLTAFGPENVPNEVLLRIHDRETSTNTALPRPRHYCDPSSRKIGLGLTEPFLEQMWATS